MLTTIILVILLILVLILLFKGWVGKKKPSEQRTSMEKLACSLFSIGRGHVEDAATSLRTARVMKREALQEIDDAIRNLNSGFKENMISLKTALKTLTEENLPKLRDLPGSLEAKARKAKKDYEVSVSKGTPIETHKNNAKKYLSLKSKAMEDIKRSEKMAEKLEITIETSKAEYDSKMTDLQMIKINLESMVDIPQIELNQSLERIRSLQGELTTRMSQDQIRSEVESELSNSNSESSYSADIDAEFDKL